jgi:hypothetical protein
VTGHVRHVDRVRPVSDSGGGVPDVTGCVRYRYRTRPVFWPGASKVARMTGLWLIAVTERRTFTVYALGRGDVAHRN